LFSLLLCLLNCFSINFPSPAGSNCPFLCSFMEQKRDNLNRPDSESYLQSTLKLNNSPKIREGFKNSPSELFWPFEWLMLTFSAIFCYCMITRKLIVKKFRLTTPKIAKKKFRWTIFEALSNLRELFSFIFVQFLTPIRRYVSWPKYVCSESGTISVLQLFIFII
jgi:hypothetical protein